MLYIKGAQFQQIIPNLTAEFPKFTKLQRPPLPKSKNKKIKVLKNDYACDERRQNILNGKFIRKKQKLLQITKQNIRLFQKINSQKSLYSYQLLNRSYQSSKSRVTNRTENSFYQSRKLQNSKNLSRRKNTETNKKPSFFNRAFSATNINQKQRSVNKIVIRNIKSSSTITPCKLSQTKPEQIKKFACLFNISEELPLQLRNRPSRINSSKIIRSKTSFHNLNMNFKQTEQQSLRLNRYRPQNRIIINKQNQIEIHEQIKEQIEIVPSGRTKSSSRLRNKPLQNCNVNIKKIQQVKKTKQNDKSTPRKIQNMNLIIMQHQNGPLLSSKHSLRSITSNNKSQKENSSTNLFQMNSIKTNEQKLFSKKLTNEKVAQKYSNILYKINEELKKTKRPKQSSIYTYKSRLIA